ncbi:1-deoxy-D-xylulose-5-phosphate synthase [Lentimicrobium saccharophilum]|uniref:1-deoxy-D-xylulose-5-phosphate synthase n=1 Tax=Lentimicrobium saccharophilum TaxID=1678841 RepID=A0A0S7C1J7_9BACT|nr:1-deoxy-D-xylulose-5-phosphate synthase [Lentimicrobium saccharophilum]GAP43905.1 1-deoxy-D-xylulose-5-phosphate synthase [Lentimicrobium saccharophilum]
MTPQIPLKLLNKINSPADLRLLREDELPLLCSEIRQFIIEVISSNPGHLGASLGAVELAVAIHYAFNTPVDKLIWDVGHQAYAHKIITGRRDAFHTNRTYGGISGFPKMSENEYDAFGVGHSSTSISAALGMATAARLLNGNNEQHIAVIGDGAMTGGMAMEALNNAGVSNTNLLVILNDNGIAIDKNVGALREYLLDIVTSRAYNKLKDKVWKMMGGNTSYGKNSRAVVKQIGNALKSTILNKSNLFEAFNFRYFGPVDGHDVVRLTKLLHDIRNIPGPRLLHVITVKGKGFEKAEQDQILYHSPGMFDKTTGEIIEKPCKSLPPKYQHVFGKTIIELAEKNPKIVGVTPAMPSGCSLNMMMSVMPHRAFDVGIAEQHAVTFSAGMAARGLIPFCNIYSSFMQRAYDQVIHDVALQGLQVVFCLDRGGLVGEDGPTHHGAYDLAYFRAIPGLTIAAPMNEAELRHLMYTAQLDGKGPFVIRYPRGRGLSTDWKKPFMEITAGTGRKLRDGEGVAILSIGHPGNFAAEACDILQRDGILAGHYDMRFLKPLDEQLLHGVFKKYNRIVTVEDGTINGGLGSAVLEFMAAGNYQARVVRLGIPDEFITQGKPEELYALCGFDTDGIVRTVRSMLNS